MKRSDYNVQEGIEEPRLHKFENRKILVNLMTFMLSFYVEIFIPLWDSLN